jgi:hypothetical protein
MSPSQARWANSGLYDITQLFSKRKPLGTAGIAGEGYSVTFLVHIFVRQGDGAGIFEAKPIHSTHKVRLIKNNDPPIQSRSD